MRGYDFSNKLFNIKLECSYQQSLNKEHLEEKICLYSFFILEFDTPKAVLIYQFAKY